MSSFSVQFSIMKCDGLQRSNQAVTAPALHLIDRLQRVAALGAGCTCCYLHTRTHAGRGWGRLTWQPYPLGRMSEWPLCWSAD